jgi:hypothetical protein
MPSEATDSRLAISLFLSYICCGQTGLIEQQLPIMLLFLESEKKKKKKGTYRTAA